MLRRAQRLWWTRVADFCSSQAPPRSCHCSVLGSGCGRFQASLPNLKISLLLCRHTVICEGEEGTSEWTAHLPRYGRLAKARDQKRPSPFLIFSLSPLFPFPFFSLLFFLSPFHSHLFYHFPSTNFLYSSLPASLPPFFLPCPHAAA